mgnify:CR=1 FL=1
MDLYLIERIIKDCEQGLAVRENHPSEALHFYIGYLERSLVVIKEEAEIFRKYALRSAENVL